MNARIIFVAALGMGIAAVLVFGGHTSAPLVRADDPTNRVLAHAKDIELGNVQPKKYEQRVSSGAVRAVLEAGDSERSFAPSSPSPADREGARTTVGCSNVFSSHGDGPDNIRVNQDCSLRRQAEEVVIFNPLNPKNLIAGQNDSRIGFNHCGYDWSFDGGKTWGDQVPPFSQFLLADGHTADACSDPTATFDANGNAYIAGIFFEVLGDASALILMKSNAGIGGAFYHSPKPPHGESDEPASSALHHAATIAPIPSVTPSGQLVTVAVDHRRPSLQPLRIVNVAMAQSTLASSSVALRVWPPPTAQSTPILPASRSRLPRLCLGLSRVAVPARPEVYSAGSGGN